MVARRDFLVTGQADTSGPALPDAGPAFLRRGLCAQTDPELWFPEKGQLDKVRAAKNVCRKCRVTSQCLEWAMETQEPYGILGGLTARERQTLRRRAT